MIQVFEATAYDKCTRGISFETYIVQGMNGVGEREWCNDQLAPYDITDDEVHMYFDEGELDDRAFIDTEDFFYLIGEEVLPNGKD